MKIKKPSLKGMSCTEYLGRFRKDKFIEQGHNSSRAMHTLSKDEMGGGGGGGSPRPRTSSPAAPRSETEYWNNRKIQATNKMMEFAEKEARGGLNQQERLSLRDLFYGIKNGKPNQPKPIGGQTGYSQEVQRIKSKLNKGEK